jgi:diguanylate cyclase
VSAHAAPRSGRVWVMGLLVVAYTGGLALPGRGLSPVVGTVLGLLAVAVPAGVCWLTVRRVGAGNREALLGAAAVTAQAVAPTCDILAPAGRMSLPFPSPADLASGVFYLLLMAGLVTAVRRRVRGLESAVWWDCAVGSLGAAAVLTVVLSPVLVSALAGSPSVSTLVATACPMLDSAFVAGAAGIVAVGGLGGVHLSNRWALLLAGGMVLAAADVVYALQVAQSAYAVGTPLDAGWAIAMVVVATWVDGAERGDGATTVPQTSPVTGATNMVVPAVATTAALGVLVASSQTDLLALAVVLAAATLLAATARTQVAFGQLVRMADVRRQATTDELTGLPNRRALYSEGHARLLDVPGRRESLLLLDLDRFREVNDCMGHHAGDLLLIQVGARLRAHLHAGDLLARLGGDEFAVLLRDAGHDQAADVATALRAALAEPFALEGVTLHSSVSIGIALFPDDGLDLGSLLRKADIAMYSAKSSQVGHHFYGADDDIDGAARLRTVQELRTALVDDQLVVHYQPKIDLPAGDVHGVEALVRWDHPTRGLLYPDAFLTLVEESGLMSAMTRVVLTLALDQAAVWRARGLRMTVSVNLAASSLVDADLPGQIGTMLAARTLPPDVLQLEITEESLMADRDRARAILTRLRHDGIQISIDDYGTGCSSLSYLRDLPIDELKLDRAFVFRMVDDARAAALVASTIDLAHSLGLRMVAEGVETSVVYAELIRLGCDQAQGYFMSRPVPAAELDHWLSTRNTGDGVGLPHQRTGPIGEPVLGHTE